MLQADHLNFKIKKYSKVAIIGENGSGKSTILSLLLRFLTPQSGEITMDGTDIARFGLDEYRSLFSVVNQEIYLFHDTIRNNICLYQQIPEASLMEVIHECGLSELINERSLDYYVGDNGSNLSGGQKQKISLARALIHDRPILIFDEATSNTDIFTEMMIDNLLKTTLKDKTVVLITHKQTVLKDMEAILFVKKGKLLEYGSYDDFLLENPEFQMTLEEEA